MTMHYQTQLNILSNNSKDIHFKDAPVDICMYKLIHYA